MAHIARSLFLALAAGAAGGAAATLVNREVGQRRSLAKSAVRAGVLAYDRIRGAMGEAAEGMSDVLAEVQSEIEKERKGAPNVHDGVDPRTPPENVAPFVAKTETEKKAHG